MYEIIEDEIHYGLFLNDDKKIERKIASVILRNLGDGYFVCDISFIGSSTNNLTPYTRNKFAGRIEGHNEKTHNTIIKNMLASMYDGSLPPFDVKKTRTLSTMIISEGNTKIMLVKDYTAFGAGTWVIIPSGKQFKYNLNLTYDLLFPELKNLLTS